MSGDPQARVVTPKAGGPPAVILPCSPDQFREFIAGLLGQPQTIRRFLPAPFEVTKDDAINLFHLLDQRLSSQNDATLIQFTASLRYDDNSSVVLNSFEDFYAYNEVKPLVSDGLDLNWTYLIQFPNKTVPEKQNIDVTFSSEHHHRPPHVFIEYERLGSGISIQIQHTARTWGVDIDALLTGHLKLLEKQIPWSRRIANKYSGQIGFLSAATAILVGLVLSYLVADHFSVAYLALAQALKGSEVSTASDLLLLCIAPWNDGYGLCAVTRRSNWICRR
jgi:hypothetical protein